MAPPSETAWLKLFQELTAVYVMPRGKETLSNVKT
jgi:hypothetical protein